MTDEKPPDWNPRTTPLGPPAARLSGSPVPSHPPVQQPMYWPQPYPARPKKKGLSAGAIVAIVLVSVFAVFCLGGVGLFALGAADVASIPKPTVSVTACSWDGYFGHLKYTLRNNDKRAHDYWIEATAGHGSMIPDSLKGVAPGETVSGELVGGSQGDCRITRVDQT